MLGMVYTELHEFVESAFSFDVADEVLEKAGLSGTWAATGLYEDGDLVRYVSTLSEVTNTPVDDLVHAYGAHLLTRFYASHPTFFDGQTTRTFLNGVESKIHREVRQLWPAANTPLITVLSDSDSELDVEYRSERGLATLALGLLEQTTRHFDDGWTVTLTEVNAGSTIARFLLTRQTADSATRE